LVAHIEIQEKIKDIEQSKSVKGSIEVKLKKFGDKQLLKNLKNPPKMVK